MMLMMCVADDLLPSLLALNDWQKHPVWSRAKALFDEKVGGLPAGALKE